MEVNETCMNEYDTYEVLSPPSTYYLNKVQEKASTEQASADKSRKEEEEDRGSRRCLCVAALVLLLLVVVVLLACVALSVYLYIQSMGMGHDLDSLRRDLALVNRSLIQEEYLEEFVDSLLMSAVENVTEEFQQQIADITKEFHTRLDGLQEEFVTNFTGLAKRVSRLELLSKEHQNATAILFSMLNDQDVRLNETRAITRLLEDQLYKLSLNISLVDRRTEAVGELVLQHHNITTAEIQILMGNISSEIDFVLTTLLLQLESDSNQTAQNLTDIRQLVHSHGQNFVVLDELMGALWSNLSSAKEDLYTLDAQVAGLFNSSTANYLHFRNLTAQLQEMTREYQLELRGVIGEVMSNVTTQISIIEQNATLLRYNLDNLLMSSELLTLYVFASCNEVFDLFPQFPSSYFRLASPDGGSPSIAYCNSNLSCGNFSKGWRRVAFVDQTMNGSSCPLPLQPYNVSSRQTCLSTQIGCSSIIYSTLGIPYSKVCGMVTGYRIGFQGGFQPFFFSHNDTSLIDYNYLDGVSVTYGSPRRHIWSLVAGHCTNCTVYKPNFVGEHFTCVQAEPGGILWGEGGCEVDDGRWFYRELPGPVSEDIELRACNNEFLEDLVFAIESIELYVK